jgi:predicted PurR-regulated permease PerM
MAAAPTKPEVLAVKDVRSVPKLGILAWSFVGAVAATAIVVTAFGAVSEILLPLLFAAVLAVVFKPLVGKLERRGLKPTLAAGVVVLGLAGLMTVVMVATVRGILQQTDEIGASVDAALANASAELDLDKE